MSIFKSEEGKGREREGKGKGMRDVVLRFGRRDQEWGSVRGGRARGGRFEGGTRMIIYQQADATVMFF